MRSEANGDDRGRGRAHDECSAHRWAPDRHGRGWATDCGSKHWTPNGSPRSTAFAPSKQPPCRVSICEASVSGWSDAGPWWLITRAPAKRAREADVSHPHAGNGRGIAAYGESGSRVLSTCARSRSGSGCTPSLRSSGRAGRRRLNGSNCWSAGCERLPRCAGDARGGRLPVAPLASWWTAAFRSRRGRVGRRCRAQGIERASYPACRCGLESRPTFCHADAATCQNSRKISQIANDFRHAGLPVVPETSLQTGHIYTLSALGRSTQEVAGFDPASECPYWWISGPQVAAADSAALGRPGRVAAQRRNAVSRSGGRVRESPVAVDRPRRRQCAIMES
jgi:hypothetical protein